MRNSTRVKRCDDQAVVPFRRAREAHRLGRSGFRRRPPRRVAQCRPRQARHRPAGASADQFGERADAGALPAAVLAAGQLRQRSPRPHRLGPQEPARAVRVLGARGLAAAAVDAHPLFRWRMQRARENAGDGKGKLHLFRQGEGEIHRRGAARDRRPRAARGIGAVQRRRTARRLVGLERRQARRRMAVLRRPAHHGDAARHLRAGLRPHRARAAGGGARPCPRRRPRRRSASCCAGRPRRWASPPNSTCATTFASASPTPRRGSPSWSRRAISCRSRSRAGTGRPSSIPPRASRARSRRAPCWRRSIR